jgi:hypothetical protein
MDRALQERIQELRQCNVPALQARYREICGQPTRCAHKEWLYRRIVWQLQAQALGGLSERALRRAHQIADEADLRSGPNQGFWSWTEPARVGTQFGDGGRPVGTDAGARDFATPTLWDGRSQSRCARTALSINRGSIDR